MKISQRINVSKLPTMDIVSFDEWVDDDHENPKRNLYLVSFDQVDYDEYSYFVVVAYSEDEARQLTPNEDVNYSRGRRLGYDCPEPDYESVRWYRDYCGQGKVVELLEEAGADLPWGYVPYSCYVPR
jgi:hypothetical protein